MKRMVLLVALSFFVFFILFSPKNASAVGRRCCPSGGTDCRAGEGYCALDPNSKCGNCTEDGGYGGSNACTNGTQLVLSDPAVYYCSNDRGGCIGAPGVPEPNEDLYCGGPCANASKPNRICCRAASCVCIKPETPTGLSNSGQNSCTGSAVIPVTFSWNLMGGATSYFLHINNTQNGWNGSCSAPNPGDYCFPNVSSTSVTVNLPVSSGFTWWVGSQNACGWNGAVNSAAVNTCSNPTPPPVTPPPATRTPTPTPRPPTPLATPTRTPTASPTRTPTATPVRTPTSTPVRTPTPTASPPPITCTVTNITPDPLNLLVNQAGTITAIVNCTGGALATSVTFVSNGVSIATVSPATDSSASGPGNNQFSTTVTGISVGSTTITATASIGSTSYPSGSRNGTVFVTAPAAWWRVKDSDVATNGNLNSNMPAGQLFDLVGAGNFPGIPAFGNSTNLSGVSVSSKGWLANSRITNPKVYDYNSFNSQVPADTSITQLTSTANNTSFNGTPSYGYTWYQSSGDLILNSNLTLNSKKVILFVNGNLRINGNINLSDGSGFFMAIVKGNIIVDPAVGGGSGPNLEGIYISNGSFSDNVGDTALYLRGSVVAYGGVGLQRDLLNGNATDPAEFFEFAPDQILLYPSKLGLRRLNWKEVAP